MQSKKRIMNPNVKLYNLLENICKPYIVSRIYIIELSKPNSKTKTKNSPRKTKQSNPPKQEH